MRMMTLCVLYLTVCIGVVMAVGCSDTNGDDPKDVGFGETLQDTGTADMGGSDTYDDTSATDTGGGFDSGADGSDDIVDSSGNADLGSSDDGIVPDTTVDTVDGGGDITVGPDTEESWDEAFDHVFPEDHVVSLTLQFAPGDWETLLSEWATQELKNEFEAAFTFDDESLTSVGVRLKGLNSIGGAGQPGSPVYGKYPLKIDFNTFGGPRFHQVDEINLGVNISDPSLMRERLAERVYAAMGVPSSRSAYGNVVINGNPVGLYTMVQVIDKRYLKERFGTQAHADDGNLYKCLHNGLDICSLKWRGDKKEDYIQAQRCLGGYEACGLVLKTNEDDATLNDYADLITFLDVLNHTPDEQFADVILQVFDVDSFLRLTAVAMATSNWDSYFGKGHNYYLYYRPDTQRFMMLPWDLDLTYEGPLCNPDPVGLDCWGPGERPLIQRILNVPKFKDQYREYLKQLVEGPFTAETHAIWIAEFNALLAPLVGSDPNIADTTGYFEQTDVSGKGEGNLLSFVTTRQSEILSALK